LKKVNIELCRLLTRWCIFLPGGQWAGAWAGPLVNEGDLGSQLALLLAPDQQTKETEQRRPAFSSLKVTFEIKLQKLTA
jgi:hypothetical protein